MKEILIIDIETTNFLNRNGCIVEVGIVGLDLDTGNMKILFDERIREPQMTIDDIRSAWIIENSDLDIEEVLSAESLDFHRETIQNIIDVHPLGITAFNRAFDINFMKSRGFTFPKLLPCPMLITTPICRLQGQYSGYKWPKAQEAFDHFFPDEDYTELHRGADDALHEAKIVFELYKNGDFVV